MITFRSTMDEHSLDIWREDTRIGMLQWHPDREPRVVLPSDSLFPWLTMEELWQIQTRYKTIQGSKK